MHATSFDPIWSEKYAQGLEDRAPYDCIVSFVYHNIPPRDRAEIRILEVGCGTGNNVWYLALEGFDLTGIDASPEAISYAKRRLAEDNVKADLRVGDFTQLPYPESTFDLVFDRGSLTHTGLSFARKAVQEIHRVLVPGGKFFFNPYAADCTSAQSGQLLDDNLTVNIDAGTLTGCGGICFYDRARVEGLFPKPWQVESLAHLQIREFLGPTPGLHSEWLAVVRK